MFRVGFIKRSDPSIPIPGDNRSTRNKTIKTPINDKGVRPRD